jgi:sugar (pentulose or hexulose) kinase
MHGFVLFDENNNNLSDFITWKKISEICILSNHIFNNFYMTGLKKRKDLPINNLNEYLILHNIYNKKLYFKNITEGLLDISFNKTHSSIACGNGFYNIYDNTYMNEYIQYFNDKYNIELIFDTVIHNRENIGLIHAYNKNIPVLCGLGDFQTSLYGTTICNKGLFINMATGSQIAQIIEKNDIKNDNSSYRPYFNTMYIKCYTHIPSGRFINIFDTFFNTFGINIWEQFNTLTLSDVYNNSNMIINTDSFFDEGLSISHIKERNFTCDNLICSILYSYLIQYVNIINESNLQFDYIMLSGGIPKKIPVIQEFFKDQLKTNIILNHQDDDSIFGVLKFINN